LDFSRQKTEEGSLVYMGRPTFDPQSNSIGTTIKDLDEFEGKILRQIKRFIWVRSQNSSEFW